MRIIDKQKARHSVSILCKMTGISPSSYYRWIEADGSGQRQGEDRGLSEAIKHSRQKSREIYGSPRIEKDLRNNGIRPSRKRVLRLMKEQGIKGRCNRRGKPLCTDSRHSERISENRLKDCPFPRNPREVVVADTTCVWTDCGWHYLATVMDLCTREIPGWSFSHTNDRDLVCQALWNASNELVAQTSVVHHSDRGSTYCSDKYRDSIKNLGMQSSMSAKGYCYDNAHMESFFGSLKCECEQLDQSLSPGQVKLALFDYIEGFYNTHRIHTALGSLSPGKYRELVAAPMGAIQG